VRVRERYGRTRIQIGVDEESFLFLIDAFGKKVATHYVGHVGLTDNVAAAYYVRTLWLVIR
jgi:hypothetical protein